MNGQQPAGPTPTPSSSLFSATNQPARRGAGPRAGQGAPRMAVQCPHCLNLAQLRTSKVLTPLVKELRFQCMDVECGHTFVASLTIDRTICPSARPNPRIQLRMASPRVYAPANDTTE